MSRYAAMFERLAEPRRGRVRRLRHARRSRSRDQRRDPRRPGRGRGGHARGRNSLLRSGRRRAGHPGGGGSGAGRGHPHGRLLPAARRVPGAGIPTCRSESSPTPISSSPAGGRPSTRAAAEAGVDSVLVADVPLLEAAPFLAAARAAGVAPVLIAAPNTPPERLARIAAEGEGYTYCVARAGVTGADAEVRFAGGRDRGALIEASAPPPVLGFGISPSRSMSGSRCRPAPRERSRARRSSTGPPPIRAREAEGGVARLRRREAMKGGEYPSPLGGPHARGGSPSGDQPPDEQDEDRADDGGDEAGALALLVPAEHVAEPAGEQRRRRCRAGW